MVAGVFNIISFQYIVNNLIAEVSNQQFPLDA